MIGTIRRFNGDYGFILPDDLSADCFFHVRDFERAGLAPPKVGDPISSTRSTRPKAGRSATRVSLMRRNPTAAGAGSNLAADVVPALADGPKPFARLLAATHGWQSTLSAAIAGLLEDDSPNGLGLPLL